MFFIHRTHPGQIVQIFDKGPVRVLHNRIGVCSFTGTCVSVCSPVGNSQNAGQVGNLALPRFFQGLGQLQNGKFILPLGHGIDCITASQGLFRKGADMGSHHHDKGIGKNLPDLFAYIKIIINARCAGIHYHKARGKLFSHSAYHLKVIIPGRGIGKGNIKSVFLQHGRTRGQPDWKVNGTAFGNCRTSLRS